MSVIRWIKETSDRFTKKVYNMALRMDSSALKIVPDHFMTQEMCNETVRRKPYTLSYVTDHLKTQEMCDKTVRMKPYSLIICP